MKKLFITAALLAFVLSCKKAGLGGDVTLVVYLEHHGNNIKNHVGWPDTVFVKFNADELPGTSPSDFDTYFIGETGEDHIHCPNLKTGKYYLYGVGFDSTIVQRVKGGMAIKLKRSDRDKEVDVHLAVTE